VLEHELTVLEHSFKIPSLLWSVNGKGPAWLYFCRVA